jgi:hypothetical protein
MRNQNKVSWMIPRENIVREIINQVQIIESIQRKLDTLWELVPLTKKKFFKKNL